MAEEFSRKVERSFLAPTASSPITITDKDGINTNDLYGIIVSIAGTGRQFSNSVTSLRVSSKLGDIINVNTIANWREWINSQFKGEFDIADTDVDFVIPFHAPDIDGDLMGVTRVESNQRSVDVAMPVEGRYKTMYPRLSNLELVIGYTNTGSDVVYRITTLHVKGARPRWVRRLREETYVFAGAGTNQPTPLSSEGQIRSFTFPVTNVDRLEIRDTRPGMGTIHDLRISALRFLNRLRGGPSVAAHLTMDPDNDERGLWKPQKDYSTLVWDLAAPQSVPVAVEELLPYV